MKRSVAYTCFRLFLTLGLAASALFAQRDLGTITGTVTDPQGSGVPNAKVTITEDATTLQYVVQTTDTGEYIRAALKPGIYTVTAEAAGFRRVAQPNIVVTGGDRVGVPIVLSVGDITQTVEISAAAPLLQTESAVLGNTVNAKQVTELPLGGQRIFTFLARLSPGVVAAEPGARDAVGGGFSANGVRSNGQNNFLLNGVDNNVNVIDFLNQTSYVIGPSVEAIGEMQILTSGYNAEYGRGAGGVLNVNLKSGTNALHGAVWEILQNNVLNANRWENNKAGNPIGPFRQNQFGGSAGGPIIKNKMFIFGDYQGTRIASTGGAVSGLGSAGSYTIPTGAMKNGDFSALLGGQVGTDALGRPILANQIFDPASTRTVGGQQVRDPFLGNKIPVSRFDPAAAKIIALYPNPNQAFPATGYPQNDYFNTTSGGQNTDQGDVRVDYKLTEKDSLFGSLSWSNLNKSNTPPFPGALDNGGFNGATEQDLGRNAQISYIRVWNPALISETRVGFSRLVTARVQYGADIDQFTAYGIGGYNPTTTLNGGLPNITLGRYSGIGASNWLPSKEYSNVWDFIQNVSLSKGSHAFKFGAEYRPIKFPFFQVPNPHGQLNFSQNGTSYPSTTLGTNGATLNTATGDELASFLLGNINDGQISTTNFISSQKSAWAFYAQDDWKITPKLTVNLGLRYELFSPIDERFGRQSNFVYDNLTLYIPEGKDQNAPLPPNFATAFPNVKVSRGQVPSTLINYDKTDIAPRIGIAYSWREKTVIRLGYGMFYGGEENQGGNPNRGESVPFNQSTNLNRTGIDNFAPNPFFPGGVSGGFPLNVFSLPAPVSFRGIATDFRNSLVQKWNFAVQHQLPWQLALEVAYIGNHQSRGLLQPDPNACPNLGTTNSALNCDSTRPTPYIGGISGTASFGYGNFNAMTAKLEKRYSSGLNFITAYTYGHALANSGTTLSGSNGFGYLDPRNISTSYSSAAWDVRHNFTTGFTYEIPYGKGKKYGSNINGFVNALIGDWQTNGILTLHTGSPYTLRSNACQGIWNTCMPDLVAGQNPQDAPSNGRNPDRWFNTAAVTKPAPLTGGNLGLQTNNAPATRTLDLSLFKDFRLTERFRIQFRAESFNFANTPQFSTPDNNLQDANFGKVTSTAQASERHIQFSLRLQF
jgi:Carboxypeptidase regulatory-like domain